MPTDRIILESQIGKLEKNKQIIKMYQDKVMNDAIGLYANKYRARGYEVPMFERTVRKNGLFSYSLSESADDNVGFIKCTKTEGFILCRDLDGKDRIFDSCSSLVRAGERYYRKYKKFPVLYYNRICAEIKRTFDDINTSITAFENLDSENKRVFRGFSIELNRLQSKMTPLSDIKWQEQLDGLLSEDEKEEICSNGEKLYSALKQFWKIRDDIHRQLKSIEPLLTLDENIEELVGKLIYADNKYQEYFRWKQCKEESQERKFSVIRNYNRRILVTEFKQEYYYGENTSIYTALILGKELCPKESEIEEKERQLLVGDRKWLRIFWIEFLHYLLQKEYSLHRSWIMRADQENNNNEKFNDWIKSKHGMRDRKLREKYQNIISNKGNKIYIKSKAKEFGKESVNTFFADFLIRTDDNIVKDINIPEFEVWNVLNNNTGICLANCIVDILYPKKIVGNNTVVEKIIRKEMRQKYEKIADNEQYHSKMRDYYEKRMESKNAWIDRADFFEMLEFVCIYFTRLGRETSWVIAIDVATEVLETFVYILNTRTGKPKEKDIKQIMKSLIFALCEIDIIAFCDSYKTIITNEEVEKGVGNQYITWYGEMVSEFKYQWEEEWKRQEKFSLCDKKLTYAERSEANLVYQMVFQWIIQNLK